MTDISRMVQLQEKLAQCESLKPYDGPDEPKWERLALACAF
jgi:hypothetical protein